MNSRTTQQKSAFQWNAGGWFGSQFGSTLWILIAALIFFTKDYQAALLTLACFLIPNLIGCWLWSSRQRIAAYPAFQILLTCIGLFSLIALFILDKSGHWSDVSDGMSVTSTYILLGFIWSGLMLGFWLKERQMRRNSR